MKGRIVGPDDPTARDRRVRRRVACGRSRGANARSVRPLEAEALEADMVYAGFSMGVMPARKLAQTRTGARGAVLIDACLPVTEVG